MLADSDEVGDVLWHCGVYRDRWFAKIVNKARYEGSYLLLLTTKFLALLEVQAIPSAEDLVFELPVSGLLFRI